MIAPLFVLEIVYYNKQIMQYSLNFLNIPQESEYKYTSNTQE